MTLPLNKRKLLSAQNAEFIARLILGGLFIYSSIHKIIDPAQFARIISNYDLFPLITIVQGLIHRYLELFVGNLQNFLPFC